MEEQNILGDILMLRKKEIEDYDFEGFPNEDGKARWEIRDVASIITLEIKFMERINQLEDKFRQLESISEQEASKSIGRLRN